MAHYQIEIDGFTEEKDTRWTLSFNRYGNGEDSEAVENFVLGVTRALVDTLNKLKADLAMPQAGDIARGKTASEIEAVLNKRSD